MRLKRGLLAGLLAALMLWAPAVWASDEDQEAKIGKAGAEQIEKEMKVVNAPEEMARIQRIVDRLTPLAQRPQPRPKVVAGSQQPAPQAKDAPPLKPYSVKILQAGGAGDINAFSLPGGYIYLTQGAMAAVESDDELAGILAHEMAHNVHKDGMDLLRREAKLNAQVGLAVLAAVLAGKNVDPGQVALFGGLVKTAVLHGYGRDAEYAADHDGLLFMQKAGYNPVGMLTVIEGFARMEDTQPNVEMGIFQTHPYPKDRADRLITELQSLHVPINRRLVTHSLVVQVKEQQREGGPTVEQILIDNAPIFEVAAGQDGKSAAQRAGEIGNRLSRQILDNLQAWEIRLDPAPDGSTIYARGEPLIHVLPADADAQKTTPQALARDVFSRLQMAFWKENVARVY
jgi:Zn-dependent protease with chaperone function